VLSFDALAAAVVDRLEAGGSIPLLAFRAPEFEQIAWRAGRRRARILERRAVAAFEGATRSVVRRDDLVAHDDGSDRFALALVSPARSGNAPGPVEVRAILERARAAMALATDRRLEAGWWPVQSRDEMRAIGAMLDAALDRGVRERRHGHTLATVAHELRTPITSIRGYVETLLDGEVDAPTARRFLETIRRETLRLGRFVEGMLEFSMLDLSMRTMQAACDVAECVHAAIATALPLARAQDVTLCVRVAQSVSARLDADSCMHVLLNLVENAAKFCGAGGLVEVACERDGDFAVVTVDDDGPGIAPPDRTCVFDLGVRGVTARPGCGIGLAVVKAVAERAGGDVRALASPLGGARFVLRLPVGPT
jgi:signal transduction histidine kinase